MNYIEKTRLIADHPYEHSLTDSHPHIINNIDCVIIVFNPFKLNLHRL